MEVEDELDENLSRVTQLLIERDEEEVLRALYNTFAGIPHSTLAWTAAFMALRLTRQAAQA